ncbi:phosphatase PAP2 family protein [Legionella jordanis]|uniref:phosphatase PAP2 family protein n=1 Tax=Legionella jordanis TaxID=456 RepID=UPI000F003AAF|nr:phosphatase PAP2 family protein [Legionella jordanis]RMX21100.1 phosphatase PAP2 family protein [Legionella jordanis]
MPLIRNIKFLRNSLCGFLVCSLLVMLSYSYFDQAIVHWINQLNIPLLKIPIVLIHFPDLLTVLSLLFILYVLLFLNYKELNKTYLKLGLAISLSIYSSLLLSKISKLFFGRPGLHFWMEQQFAPGAYRFHWFEGYYVRFQSFPSGHTAVTFAVLSVLWFIYPKCRALALLVGVAIIFGLIASNNHFLADCLAGAYLGIVLGYISTVFFGFVTAK